MYIWIYLHPNTPCVSEKGVIFLQCKKLDCATYTYYYYYYPIGITSDLYCPFIPSLPCIDR